MKITRLSLLAVAAAVSIAFGSSAFAVSVTDGFITVSDSGGGTGTNVLYNPGETGFSINASFNSNSQNFNAVFTSTEMITSSGGQASLMGVDGGIRDLTFSLTDGATFTTLVLNPDALNGSDGQITFSVTYIMPAGVFNTVAFTLNANGSNFFRIDASNGALITQVTWNSTVDVVDANQYRIEGAAPAQAVPEGGATLMLLGASLGALALARRTLPRRSSAA